MVEKTAGCPFTIQECSQSTHLDAVNDVRREIERDSLEPKQTASIE